MTKPKHKKLPPLILLEERYEYDPVLGGLFPKGAEHIEQFALGRPSARGYSLIYIEGKSYLLHRLCFYMYHRRDPRGYVIDHINGDPGDNRINNLRRCRAKANGLNRKSKGRYTVDADGVGRWVSGVV